MFIPRYWERSETRHVLHRDSSYALSAWGWSDSSREDARALAAGRLLNLVTRAQQRGFDARRDYAYANTPLREEIIERFAEGSADPHAIITRNSYGCLILNTSEMLFIDVDVPETPPAGGVLLRLFGRRESPYAATAALNSLRIALLSLSPLTFRVYRTAGGYRAIAVNQAFDPASPAAAEVFEHTAADTAFAHLCRVQRSFRARLTPKPWRMKMVRPPGRYPRDAQMSEQHDAWLELYHRTSARFASCAYLETIGKKLPLSEFEPLIALHDGYTRCGEAAPLA